MNDHDTRDTLDVRSAAELLKCSPENIKRLARRGDLHAFKFGGVWFISKNSLEELLRPKLKSELSSAPHSGGSE